MKEKRTREELWAAMREEAKSGFFKKLKLLHGGNIDAAEAEYVDSHTPLKLKCVKHSITFEQRPNNALNGRLGCPTCKTELKRAANPFTLTTEKFIEMCRAVHGDRYDYSKTVYVSAHKPATFTCRAHGDFEQIVRLHHTGAGCQKCAGESAAAKQMGTKEEFIQAANEVHNGKYDYSRGEYKGNLVPYEIVCEPHGVFWQTPKDHKQGNGCPKCGCAGPSKPEKEISSFVGSLGFEIISGDRKQIAPRELDIFVPNKRVAIEYNGLYFHSEKFIDSSYHLNKLQACEAAGIDLIQVFEDEWENQEKREIVKSIIAARLGNCERRIYARNTEVSKITAKEARGFLTANHLQGFAASEAYYALKTKSEEIVSVMLLTTPRKGITVSKNVYDLELVRFASLKNTSVIGGFSKLLKVAGDKKVVTYCDRRVFNAKGYEAVGFKKLHHNQPEYYYNKSRSGRLSRLGFQKRHLAKKLETYDPSKTEHENMMANGYYRVYGCGTTTMVLNCDLL